MVHKDWIQSANGFVHRVLDLNGRGRILGPARLPLTLVPYTGQVFFQENWNDQVFRTSTDSLKANRRTPNSQDRFSCDASRNYNGQR